MYFLYSTLLASAAFAALPLVLLKSLREPDLRRHLDERLGGIPASARPSPSPLWLQAVSVGEVRVALRLLEKMREGVPEMPVVLTSTTPAGRRLAARSLGGNSRVCYFPLDLPAFISRGLNRVRPRALVLMETEIWPNLIRESSRRGIPVILANGRISDRSFPRYRWIRPLIAPALARMDLLCMQSEGDAERIQFLGAPKERIQVTGNIKWDFKASEHSPATLRRNLGIHEGATVLVAGSTAPGEEEVVLEAWSEVRTRFPDLHLVLAPRHPQRFDSVARLLQQRGIPFARRSAGSQGTAPVLLLDTLGELGWVYSAGTVCFVGGSLVSRGGQNLMEPAAAGRPVLFGPRTENFQESANQLLESGAGFRVTGASTLAATLARLLTDPGERESAGSRAQELMLRNRGAAGRTAGMIMNALDQREG